MTIFLTLLIGRPNCNCIIYFESIFGLKLNHQNAIQYSKKKKKKGNFLEQETRQKYMHL